MLVTSPQETAFDRIIFDHDGTLFMTLEEWAQGYAEVFAKPWPVDSSEHALGAELGLEPLSEEERGGPRIDVSREEIIAGMGKFRMMIHEKWGQSREVADLLVAEAHALVKPRLERVPMYPGSKETLQALGQLPVQLALASKSHRAVVEVATRYNGVDHHFGSLLGGNELEEHEQKPHPRSIELSLERLAERYGESTGEILVVGDNCSDLEAANTAGVASVLFRPPENAPFYNYDEMVKKCPPTYEITRLSELVDIVITGEHSSRNQYKDSLQ